MGQFRWPAFLPVLARSNPPDPAHNPLPITEPMLPKKLSFLTIY
ncbi:hypothetical protein BN1184_BS_00570 [Pantoea ananatis]|nr:hypothetical protein BN1184_BS_00570 [Pantoea ananatis]